MRGKVFVVENLFVFYRITPAYAGKSKKGLSKRQRNQDHPRLCGEKALAKSVSSAILGSPPPMRGKGYFLPPIFLSARITPAYAGKSVLMNTMEDLSEDHPRLCGEKLSDTLVTIKQKGSPPPMRGKDPISKFVKINDRITPAYAGKSSDYNAVLDLGRDHPRLCGEK